MTALTIARTLPEDEKAAIVLFSLGPERAEQFLKRMDRLEHRRFAHALNRLSDLTLEQVAAVLAEFTADVAREQALPGGGAGTRDFLHKVLEAQSVEEIMADIEGVVGADVWQRLSDTPERTLAPYLEQETPQTVAVILSKLRPEKAAQTLMSMPEDRARQVVLRLAHMGRVDHDVMEDLQLSLMQDYATRIAQDGAGGEAHNVIATIFSEMSAEHMSPLMELLQQEAPQAAEAVQKVMFRFDDILSKVRPPALQVVIRNCQKEPLVLALRLAIQKNPKVADYFMENMSKRAAEQLREEMQGKGAVRVKDAERAQAEIVRLIQDLARDGEIILAEAGDEEPLVE